MICPSLPLRALARPIPTLARQFGRALNARDFISLRRGSRRAWLGEEKRRRRLGRLWSRKRRHFEAMGVLFCVPQIKRRLIA